MNNYLKFRTPSMFVYLGFWKKLLNENTETKVWFNVSLIFCIHMSIFAIRLCLLFLWCYPTNENYQRPAEAHSVGEYSRYNKIKYLKLKYYPQAFNYSNTLLWDWLSTKKLPSAWSAVQFAFNFTWLNIFLVWNLDTSVNSNIV